MVNDRKTLVLYTSAICNLKCVYCYIDKNPALVQIDKLLEESFASDYYFDFCKEMFPNPTQLKDIEFWGGEPTIGLERAIPVLNKIIPYYPYLNRFMMSTNLTLPNVCEILSNFLKMLGSYPDRKFIFCLQLSLDGPKYINDASRGEGTTEKFVKNYLSLIKIKVPNNVMLRMFFKATMSCDTIRKLQTKEAIIDYYSFFDKLLLLNDFENSKNITMFPTIPNTASPSPHTKEDGILFANLCKICNQIEDDGLRTYFKKYTDNIMPFRNEGNGHNELDSPPTMINGGICGSGKCVIGLLPQKIISCCHSGFTDLISNYKIECQKNKNRVSALEKGFLDFSRNRVTLTQKQFEDYEKLVENYYLPNVKIKNSNSASIIKLMADAGQIEEKFSDMEIALKAADFVERRFSYCIRDNINSTGCIELQPLGVYRLLLNGAMEEILK